MSGKRFAYVTDDSSEDDDDYQPRYKSSRRSCDKFENSVGQCQTLQKEESSCSSFDMNLKTRRSNGSKRPCMNKNAVTARENRIRKKKYLEQVESQLSFYQKKTKCLVNVIEKQDVDIKKLKGEVSYLRCILKNNTKITALLQSMNEGLTRTSKPLANIRNSGIMDQLYGRKLSSKNNMVADEANVSVEKLIQRDGGSKGCWIESTTKNTGRHLDFDHTYTIPEMANARRYGLNADTGNLSDQDVDEADHKSYKDQQNEINSNVACANDKVALNSPAQSTVTSFSNNSDELIDVENSDTAVDGLERLELDIYDDLNNFEQLLNPLDNAETIPNLFDDSNLLDHFENAGICLHVNSDRISLEFCSICHMNSINSPIE